MIFANIKCPINPPLKDSMRSAAANASHALVQVMGGTSSPTGCSGFTKDVLGRECLGEKQRGGCNLCFQNADFSMELRVGLNDAFQAELPASAV